MKPATDLRTGFRIRPASVEDAAALARLSDQLGYPASEEQVRHRLAEILKRPDHAVFVAEASRPNELLGVAGWVHGFIQRTIESDATVEIGGLVVDENQRGLGAGQRLIDQLEKWARTAESGTITVRSNVIRERAHVFYQRLGFVPVKTQRVFRKPTGEQSV